MKHQVISAKLSQVETECLIVGVKSDNSASVLQGGEELDSASGGRIKSGLALGRIEGKVGQSLMLFDIPNVKAKRVLLVGVGEQSQISLSKLVEVIQAASSELKKRKINEVAVACADFYAADESEARIIQTISRVLCEEAYYYAETKVVDPLPIAIDQASYVVAASQLDSIREGVREGEAIANALNYVKRLSDLPGNICTPSYLASEALSLSGGDVKTVILEESDMKKLGMGSLLSVSRGSVEPAKLIIMEYYGSNQSEKPIVLVGKGLTFDAGGISLKPAGGMEEMKYDMCGGASVLGVISFLKEFFPKINVVGIVPSSENLPDGMANKPGDVVTSMSGKTIEVINTDAEGRLILCDALTYAQKKYDPSTIIDIATLTGACVIALGAHNTGLFSNSDKLAAELLKAGLSSGDEAWRMPLGKKYREQLKSLFADMSNVGGKGAGAVTAACFLEEFIDDGVSWAHLDVAGTAWNSVGSRKGATGRPVKMLIEFLLQTIDKKSC